MSRKTLETILDSLFASAIGAALALTIFYWI